MGTSLQIKTEPGSGSTGWSTVVEPYINVSGEWRSVHNVWIKHGGTWRVAHKTAIGRYELIEDTDESDALLDMTDSTEGQELTGSYTVPNNVRYLRIKMIGGQGQGGGGARARSNHPDTDAHYSCTGSFTSTNGPQTVTGGFGGTPGLLDITIEVIPGEEYTWSGGIGGYNAGGAGGDHVTNYHQVYGGRTAVGSYQPGFAGQAGTNFVFTGPSATLTAGGGGGGALGLVEVLGNCTGPGGLSHLFGYTIGTTNGANGSVGTNTIVATNPVTTTTNGASTESGSASAGSYSSAGGRGDNAKLSIWQYAYTQDLSE